MTTNETRPRKNPRPRHPAVILDIDGTLADTSHRAHLAEQGKWDAFYSEMHKDTPITQVREVLKFIKDWDYAVFIVTSRPEKYREETLQWLRKFYGNLTIVMLFMRPDDNTIKDTDFKIQTIKKIERYYDIFAIFEDRKHNVDAFRTEGWFVFDVAGNTF